MSSFQQFDPAIRIVNSAGNVTRPELRLSVNSNAMTGLQITLSKTSCRYSKQELGPFTFADWAMAPSILGYRAHVDLEFGLMQYALGDPFASAAGPGLMLQYYKEASLIVPSFAPLQFNLFYSNQNGTESSVPSPWRGVYTESDWDIDPLGAQSAGVAWTFKLYTRDLIDAPGNWAQRTW